MTPFAAATKTKNTEKQPKQELYKMFTKVSLK